MTCIKTQTQKARATEIESLINDGISEYFQGCHRRLPSFTKRHFNYPGCWYLNKQAFGLDLLRAPLNLIWAPIYIVLIVLLLGLSLLGLKKLRRWSTQLPGGMTTRVQRSINTHIQNELVSTQALQHHLAEKISDYADEHALAAYEHNELLHQLEHIIADALKQLMLTRTASADISNTVMSTLLGAMAFKKFTPGGIGIGLLLSAIWVKARAQESFFLGSGAGSLYYGLFPPSPNYTEQAIGITVVMLVLSIIASFSGLLSDPLQYWTGLHKRRLKRMLNQLEADLYAGRNSQFKPLDSYVARILEVFDTLKVTI